jgi:hypothetical protein
MVEHFASVGSNKEYIKKRSEKIVTHGQKRRGNATPEYKTWLRIKKRCYLESDKDYANWGGRGIRVCDRWINDFSAFFSDMGKKPSPSHSIDRLDPNLHYSPDNCRWASQTQQASENRRNLIPITINGETFISLSAACRHFGIGITTFHNRLKTGIMPDDAVTKNRLKPRR